MCSHWLFDFILLRQPIFAGLACSQTLLHNSAVVALLGKAIPEYSNSSSTNTFTNIKYIGPERQSYVHSA